jgi:hypothetical protein
MESFGVVLLCGAAVGSCDSFPWSECVCLPVLVPRFGLELSPVSQVLL